MMPPLRWAGESQEFGETPGAERDERIQGVYIQTGCASTASQSKGASCHQRVAAPFGTPGSGETNEKGTRGVGAESFLHSRKGVLYTFLLKTEDALSYE